MQRFTISLDDHLAEEFDALITARGYDNRSEAVRDLLRNGLDRQQESRDPKAGCVACLSYVYNHHELDLAARLTALQHEHHDLTITAQHVHLDHDHCVESVILSGPVPAVRRFADAVIATRGVHHGQVNLVVVADSGAHRHPGGRPHRHVAPKR